MKWVSLLILWLVPAFCVAQLPYWQQQVDVTIHAELHENDKTIDGVETISYTNNSPDTLHVIWFHLWPNAYKNDKTAFSEQLLQQGNTAFYFSAKEKRGYINRLEFKVAGLTAKWEDHPEHSDIIKLLLPTPLPPAAQVCITTPFHVKLPALFSRSGYQNGAFQLTQWYPKPAVYDAAGWHPMPYLEQGEFYSDFGNYDVWLTLPQHYIVAATGMLQDAEETQWLNERKKNKEKTATPPATVTNKQAHLKKLKQAATINADTNFFKTPYAVKTLRFKQAACHDFALVANKTFIVDADTCKLANGKIIDVALYYTSAETWKNSMAFAKAALRFYSSAVGAYPYANLSVVESAGTQGGGMEYPALALIGRTASPKELDRTIAHEIGHNWFYAALATNERTAPWLDEGINTFYERKYVTQKYGAGADLEGLLLQTLVKQKKDQPITTAAPDFSQANYALVAYYKTALWLRQVEQKLGEELFQNTMQQYYKQWRFKHPREDDFKAVLAAAMADTSVFAQLHQTGCLTQQLPAGLKIISPVAPHTIKQYVTQPAKKAVLVAPAAGFNLYDNFMIGGVVSNYNLPPAALQFLAVPLYATGSKKWNGIGRMAYSRYPNTRFSRIEASVSGMGFSKSLARDSNQQRHYERFYKVTPAVRFTLKQPLQSSRETWAEVKTYVIKETTFSNFSTALDGLTYVDSFAKTVRYVNQLTYHTTDYRTLYPYHYSLQLQQAQAFYRINATGNYFFNYARGGGVGVRLFFGKFGYVTRNRAQRAATTRYQPKLLGTTGDEDYTYRSYFIGRSASYAAEASVVENSGLAAQQIALRDGAFKLRIDPFDFLQGRSQNWVTALNFASTLPRQLIPSAIPLKLFLDVGTYAEASQASRPTNRILYVAGLQLSFFKNLITLYAPVMYSADFRDNLKSLPEQNTFLKRLTFSIDVTSFSLKQLTGNKFSL